MKPKNTHAALRAERAFTTLRSADSISRDSSKSSGKLSRKSSLIASARPALLSLPASAKCSIPGTDTEADGSTLAGLPQKLGLVLPGKVVMLAAGQSTKNRLRWRSSAPYTPHVAIFVFRRRLRSQQSAALACYRGK